MNEAKFMYSFNRKYDFGHVKAGDVLCEDFVLDEHRHQITSRQELHEHIQEGVVLERSVQLDDPRAVRLCENITLGSHVSKLVFFELRIVSDTSTKRPVRSTISCFTSDFSA